MLNLDQQKKLLASLDPESVPSEKRAEYEELQSAVEMFRKMEVLEHDDDDWLEIDFTKEELDVVDKMKKIIETYGGDKKEGMLSIQKRFEDIIEDGGRPKYEEEIDPELVELRKLQFNDTPGTMRNYDNQRRAFIAFADTLEGRLTKFFTEIGVTDQDDYDFMGSKKQPWTARDHR